jgi:AraC family transcriptional regulator of adaptative response/methylated-DNA-[protein]-cysteine methyltransferase
MQEVMQAATYKRNGKGASIRFAIAPCAFGYVLIAATEQGICAASLGDGEESLESSLQQEFRAASVQRDDAALETYTTTILRHLEGREPNLDLPLDVHGTPFQWRVWQELRAIPYGETRTYTEVAQAIGQPQSVRAVARACATNSLSLLIPCHRVLRKDSTPSGYRWVLERKHKLLQHEAQCAARSIET